MEVAKRDTVVATPRGSGGLRAAERRLGVAFVLPSVLILAAIIVYPLFETVRLSFTNKDFIKPASGQFVGLDNYVWLATNDEFWLAFRNSVLLTVFAVGIQVVLAIIIGLMLNRAFFGRGLVRSTFILPWALPAFVVAFAFRWMLDPTFGIVNQLLVALHLAPGGIAFLSDPMLALPTVIAAHVWRGLPWVVLVILAGLQLIPHEIQEAARIDGASGWQEFWNVTLPSLRFVITIAVLLRTIWTFNWFDLTKLLAGGSNVTSTMILPILVFNRGFQGFKLGQASAVAGVMVVALALFMYFFLRLMTEEGEI